MDDNNTILTDDEKREIIRIISERVPNVTCPMCHHNNFIIADGYFNMPISKNIKDIVIAGSTIPSIGIVCTNCGFISFHALGVLGLLNQEEAANE